MSTRPARWSRSSGAPRHWRRSSRRPIPRESEMAQVDVDVESEVQLQAGGARLIGSLGLPTSARAVVLFAHGSGSSRHSPRNRAVARALRQAGMGTLLIDLLTQREEAEDEATGHLRFDIGLLAGRLAAVTDWLQQEPSTETLPV